MYIYIYVPEDGIGSCYWGVGTLDTFWRPTGRCFSSWRPRCIREAWRAEPKPFAIAFPVFCTWPSGFETIPKTPSLSNAKTRRSISLFSYIHLSLSPAGSFPVPFSSHYKLILSLYTV